MILYRKYQSGAKADNPTYAAMSKVVTQRNANLPWVKRYLEGNKPVINNKDGTRSSHLLATFGGDNGKEYVAPTIIEKDGKLIELSPDDAWEHAKKNKTLMGFKDKRFADYYSRNGLIKH